MVGQHNKKWQTVLIIILIAYLSAVLLEATVFNLRHWTTRFIGPSVNALGGSFAVTRHAPERDIFTSPWEPIIQELTISNINQPIRTVFVRPQFDDLDIKMINISIRYHDESSIFTHNTQIINGYMPSYYIPIGAMGTVDNVTIIINDARVAIQEVFFNTPLPWIFQWVRVLLLTFAVSLVWLWKKFGFSKIPFNPQLEWQRWVDAGVVAVFVCLMLFVMFFSFDFGFIPGQDNEFEWEPPRYDSHAINSMMVDALLMGQLHLDMEAHESLLNATQPHSIAYRGANWIHSPWDFVFFNGRFYSYFGITPVVLLFLPYYLMRGEHLSNTSAALILCAIGSIGIYLLWKELVKKYLKDIPYTMYLAGLAAALFGSNLMTMAVRARHYEAAVAGGLMLSVWGLYFILRAVYDDSYDKIETRFLFWGGLCLALAVGSRPTMILSSLLVPVLLWPVMRSCLPLKKVFGCAKARVTIGLNILALAIPYIVIGGLLAWYNFARFGSIVEFGATYQLTQENVAVVTHTGALGNLRRAFDGVFTFLFTSFTLRPHFPFVFANHSHVVFTGYMSRTPTIGTFMLPVTWFLLAMLHLRKRAAASKAIHIIVSMFALGVLIAILSTVLIGPMSRYSVDFFWLLIFPSLLCMGFVYKEACQMGDVAARFIRRLSFTAVGVTCFILLGWGMVGENNHIWYHNPVVIRFLSDLFTIF